jgi:hypothetical protein
MFYLISKDPMTQYLLRIYRSCSLTTILGSNSVLFFLTSLAHDTTECSNGFQ